MLNNLNNEILIIYSGKDAINNRLVNIAMSKYEKNKLIYHYPFNFIAKNIEKTNIIKYLDNIKKKNNTFPTIYIYDSLNKIKQIIEEKYKEIDIIIYSKEQCDKFNREIFRRYTLFNFILDNLKYKSKNISLYYFTYSDKDNIGEIKKGIFNEFDLDNHYYDLNKAYTYHYDKYNYILLFESKKDCYSYYLNEYKDELNALKNQIEQYENKLVSLDIAFEKGN